VSSIASVQRYLMAAANAGIAPDARRFQRRGSDPLATHQNELFAEKSVGTGENNANVTRWALTDHQATVRDILSHVGTLIDTLTYTAFGTIAAQTAPAEALRMAYTGYVLDAETGLSYANARYLDTAQGRWLSVDPLGFAAGDTNLYRYVGNDAMGETDPTGTQDGSWVDSRMRAIDEDLASKYMDLRQYILIFAVRTPHAQRQ
jgi:RHS repeat-associated protein